jgi:hypothetical protein
MSANYGQMPVLMPNGCQVPDHDGTLVSIFSGYGIHVCMTHASRLKFLADWVVINGLGVASPGDFLEWGSEAVWVACLVIWATLMIKDRHEGKIS